MKEIYDAVIIGAGLSGLSCAYELSSRGRKVAVVEKRSYVGGRTSSFSDNGMAVESGLHRYIGYYSALPRLLRKCGADIDKIVTWEDKVDILVKNENKKIVLGLAPLLAPVKTLRGILGNTDALSLKDKMSLLPFFVCGFASYLFSEKLDSYSVADYAKKHKVTPRAESLILEPLSSGIFFLPPEKYSAYAFFGLFAPVIPKFYKMRIGAFLGGMSDVMCKPVAEKITSLGGKFFLNETAETVMLAADGSAAGVRCVSGKEFYGKNVVVAATLPAAKRILAHLPRKGELRKLFALPEMSACTVQIELSRPALKKDITTFGPSTDLVSFAEQSRTTFRKSKGRLSLILGNPDKYIGKTAKELIPGVVEQLMSLGVNISDSVVDARKVSEENEFYSLSKGSQSLRPGQSTPVKGLYLAGDYTLTSSFATMEGAVLSGKKAADLIISGK